MNTLAQIWRWFVGLFRKPKQEQTTIPVAEIICPCCKTDYTGALRSIPVNASQATVVCSNPHCKEQMEVFPDARWGWLAPKTVLRTRAT